jgi:hypothetical protein
MKNSNHIRQIKSNGLLVEPQTFLEKCREWVEEIRLSHKRSGVTIGKHVKGELSPRPPVPKDPWIATM